MPTVEDIINIGFSKHQNGFYEEAEIAYKEAFDLDCENAEVCNLMGVLKLQQNDTDSAIDWVEKAINLQQNEYFYETLFQAYIRGKFFEKIIESSKIVLQKYPKNFSLVFNIALAYKNLNQNMKAIEFYDKALKIDPTSYNAWYNLSHLYSVEGQCKNAVSALKICNKLKPNDDDTQYFYGLSLMRIKNYDKGLKFFEKRAGKETAIELQAKTYPNLASKERLWNGENIKNKTILVYHEAGYGDVIMFSRYLPILKKQCKKLIFSPQKPLVPLFSNSNLGIDEILEGFIPEKMLDFDVHTPIMSLPYLLKIKEKNIFNLSEGYLNADSKLMEEYHNKIFNTDKMKIGIKWQGNTYYDRDRVISVEAFEPLLELENVDFYSFQTFEGSEDLSKLQSKYNIIDIGKDLLDFGQTAAALSNLDLVICNDTSLAHLAGALGIPCYIMLPYEVNWRWHDNLAKCDWYDSVKLFRQHQPGNWNDIVSDIIKTIQK